MTGMDDFTIGIVLVFLSGALFSAFLILWWAKRSVERANAARAAKPDADIPIPTDPRWTSVEGKCNCGGCVVLIAGDVVLSDSEISFSLRIGETEMTGAEGALSYVEAVVAAWRRRTLIN